jgi:hypothetical protein
MTKYYLDPDTRQSIDDQTHPPKPWLDPDIRRRIIAKNSSRSGYQIAQDTSQDIDAIPADTNGGGGGYVGPLDIVAGAAVAYSSRALSIAKRGTPLYTILRDSDNATQVFNSDSVTGEAPSAAISDFISGTFDRTGTVVADGNPQITLDDATGVQVGQTITGLGVPDSTVVTNVSSAPLIIVSNNVSDLGPTSYTFTQFGRVSPWVDQSGNAHDIPYTAANFGNISAYWIANALNSKPAINCQQSDTAVLSASSFSSGAVSFFVVGRGTLETGFFPSGSGNQAIDLKIGQTAFVYIADATVNSVGGDYTNALSNDTYFIWEGAFEFGTKILKTNGSDLAEQSSYDSGGVLGPINDSFYNLNGFGLGDTPSIAVESIFYDLLLSDEDRLAIRQNIATYYGITLS